MRIILFLCLILYGFRLCAEDHQVNTVDDDIVLRHNLDLLANAACHNGVKLSVINDYLNKLKKNGAYTHRSRVFIKELLPGGCLPKNREMAEYLLNFAIIDYAHKNHGNTESFQILEPFLDIQEWEYFSLSLTKDILNSYRHWFETIPKYSKKSADDFMKIGFDLIEGEYISPLNNQRLYSPSLGSRIIRDFVSHSKDWAYIKRFLTRIMQNPSETYRDKGDKKDKTKTIDTFSFSDRTILNMALSNTMKTVPQTAEIAYCLLTLTHKDFLDTFTYEMLYFLNYMGVKKYETDLAAFKEMPLKLPAKEMKKIETQVIQKLKSSDVIIPVTGLRRDFLIKCIDQVSQ